MDDIKGKVIAITGASSGIGEAIARHLSSLGAKVALGARRVDELEKITNEISKIGGEAIYKKVDVTQSEEVNRFVEFIVGGFGTVDVFINNAGVMPLSMINTYKIEEWHKMIDVNIKGVLHGIAAALPVFEAKDSGQFINITSVGDRWVGPTSTVYS